jgi:hypothetical protein
MECSLGLEAFICTDLEDGTPMMRKAPWLECYDDGWYERLPVHIVILVVYAIGLPVSLAIVLFRARNRGEIESPAFLRRWGSIFKGFKAEYFWWDIFAMFRKFALMCCAVFFQRTTTWQAIAGLFVLIGFLITEVHINPFKLMIVNVLQSVIDMILIFILTAGVLVSTTFTRQEDIDALSWFTVAIFVTGAVTAVGCIMAEVRVHRRIKRAGLSLRSFSPDRGTYGLSPDAIMQKIKARKASFNKVNVCHTMPLMNETML